MYQVGHWICQGVQLDRLRPGVSQRSPATSRCRKRVDPSGARPQTITLELNDESAGPVGSDDDLWVVRVGRFIAGARDFEGTWSKAAQSRHCS
jgi:hypothetical protein